MKILTDEQKERDLKAVTNIKDKNEKLSWTRRQKSLEKVIEEEINPLSEQIMILENQRRELYDKVMAARQQMVKECIHPKNSLVHMDDHILCKFCDRKLSIPRTKWPRLRRKKEN